MPTMCRWPQVTNENKREYAQLAAREKMTTSIREAVEAFQRGMWEVVPLPLLRIFTNAELELLISGLPDIDVADLRRHTVYGGGFSASDRLSQWFWSIVEDMDKQDVALLLQFATGVRLLWWRFASIVASSRWKLHPEVRNLYICKDHCSSPVARVCLGLAAGVVLFTTKWEGGWGNLLFGCAEPVTSQLPTAMRVAVSLR